MKCSEFIEDIIFETEASLKRIKKRYDREMNSMMREYGWAYDYFNIDYNLYDRHGRPRKPQYVYSEWKGRVIDKSVESIGKKEWKLYRKWKEQLVSLEKALTEIKEKEGD